VFFSHSARHAQLREKAGALKRIAVVATLALSVLTACEDPFAANWTASPDTARLYSLARPEINLPSAFNFNFRAPVVIESASSSGSWDLALDTQAGGLVFLPPGALGINSRARITSLTGVRFEDVTEAPADTALYVSRTPLKVTLGTIYVVQTGQTSGTFGQRCVFYAKLQPIEIDVAGGILKFLFDANPFCNDTRLVPPDDS
jgi:hypothetical protein